MFSSAFLSVPSEKLLKSCTSRSSRITQIVTYMEVKLGHFGWSVNLVWKVTTVSLR